MTTIISHVYNEEALLPLWLEHHSKYFENGLIIDFDSTDKTRDIISMYPSFKVVESPLKEFDAAKLDDVVSLFERDVSGVRMILNATEFLMGDPCCVEKDYLIPSVSLINMPHDNKFDWSKQFFVQRKFGISYEDDFSYRRSRILTNRFTIHPLGRHYESIDAGDYLIIHVANCLVDKKMIKRRMQIQHKIPQRDKESGLGFQHYHGPGGLTHEKLMKEKEELRSRSKDLSYLIDKYIS